MEEFQTKQKSNFFMGLICLIAGALATTISVMGYNHFVKGSENFGFILGAILNAAGIIYGEFLDGCAEIAKSYDMSMSDLMFNTDLLKEALTTGSFWTYPGIGIAIMLIIGFINRKANFSDKDDE